MGNKSSKTRVETRPGSEVKPAVIVPKQSTPQKNYSRGTTKGCSMHNWKRIPSFVGAPGRVVVQVNCTFGDPNTLSYVAMRLSSAHVLRIIVNGIKVEPASNMTMMPENRKKWDCCNCWKIQLDSAAVPPVNMVSKRTAVATI
uniref:Uncharacterized protein n=1 Tax=Amphora coffeiformis TaxID=265554 RepID=A0A7S3P5A0_9STRA